MIYFHGTLSHTGATNLNLNCKYHEKMNWFRDLTRSGLHDGDAYQKKRSILFANYISLVLSGCILLLFFIRRFIFGQYPGGLNLTQLAIAIVMFLVPILLNRSGQTTLSRLVLCYSPVAVIWLVYISVMKDMEIIEQAGYDSQRIHLLAVSFIPYLLLDIKKPLVLAIGILPTIVSLLFFDSILSLFELGINQRGVPGIESILIGPRTFIAYCIISGGCLMFQSIISYNDELNRKILSELKLKSEKIKSQNEQLMENQNTLNEINLHLEELVLKKTESIKQQNERLLKYAHSNAHDVRGPIARLLGLVQLSRLKTDLDYPWFFEKMENESNKLDEIVKKIASELDQIDQDTNTKS